MLSTHHIKAGSSLIDKRYEYDVHKGGFVPVELKDSKADRIAIYFSTDFLPDSSSQGASFYVFSQELTRRLMLRKDDPESEKILSVLRADFKSITSYRFESPHVKNIYAMANYAFYQAMAFGNKAAEAQRREEGPFPTFAAVVKYGEGEEIVQYRSKKQRVKLVGGTSGAKEGAKQAQVLSSATSAARGPSATQWTASRWQLAPHQGQKPVVIYGASTMATRGARK